MAKSKATCEKSQRERLKRQKSEIKRKEKLDKKEMKKALKEEALPLENGEDPDLAGIVAGPQPERDDW